MRGGLITTDSAAASLLLNRTGEEILVGCAFNDSSRQEPARPETATSGFPANTRTRKGYRSEKRIDFRHSSRAAAISGHQYLPLFARVLRIEAAMFSTFRTSLICAVWSGRGHPKERMAALGRLLPPSRTRFASPSRPWPERQGTGSSRPRWKKTRKRLVNIVSRESERLNAIITDFLNYSKGEDL